MMRIGAIVRRLYAEELKDPAADPRGRGRRSWPRTRSRLSAMKKSLFGKRSVVWAIRIAAVLVVVFVIVETIFQFNRLMSWSTIVTARCADVDRELKRRENLIPNLVYAVSEYASYERGVFRYVSDAREALQMMRSGEAPGSKASSVLEQLLPRLIALAEEYPDLKATQSIQDLISEVANTENRIAEAKKEYNKAAEVYNQYCTMFPGNLYVFIFRLERAPYIGLDEQVEVPAIDLKVTERDAGGASAG